MCTVESARRKQIATSKAAAVGRMKDRLFLATHAEALRELLEPALGRDGNRGGAGR